MRVLLLTPPMTQLNTPYPATAYLTGFLRAHAADLELTVSQADASLALFLRLYSAPWVERMADTLARRARRVRRALPMPPSIAQLLAHAPRYVGTVEPAVRFLQGRDPSLALRIVGRAFLPEGPRFAPLAEAAAAGDDPLAGRIRQPRHDGSSTLPREPLHRRSRGRVARRHRPAFRARALRRAARGERVRVRAARKPRCSGEPTLVDEALDELTRELVALHRPDVVGMSAPFPGNVYGAFRMARIVRTASRPTRSSCSAAAGSTPSCARSASRASSITSTT